MKVETATKLGFLGSLYVAQYIPLGLFAQALPTFMRHQGFSLEAIGMTSLLGLPWMFKLLWAPVIDHYGSAGFGHYRSWLVPLEALLALIALFMAGLDFQQNFSLVLICFFLICFLAATQDVATDALAVNILAPEERGWGNGIQAAANALGAVLGGGVLLILLSRWGWKVSMLVLSLSLVLPLIPVLLYRDRAVNRTVSRSTDRFPDFKALINFFRRPKLRAWLAVIVVYMMGGVMATTMLRPLLVDLDLSLADIGFLTGVVGYGAAMVAALIAGFWIVTWGRKRAAIGFSIIQAIAVATCLLPALGVTNLPVLYLVNIANYFALGMAQTILFTLMMDRSELKTAGTDYTAQTSLIGIGGMLAGVASGLIAEAIGYTGLFVFSFCICLLSVFLVANYLDFSPQSIGNVPAIDRSEFLSESNN